ncbi:MAG: helix-turn-helix transcriptional regulator [Aestuariibacter sp.]|nr:helix-turn-helix transcriptional regulator [Aestuariibacter sp.]
MKTSDEEFQKARVNLSITPGEMLKTVRELQGLSQNELAKLSGISQSNISAIENGTRNIGRERALTFGKILKVHPAVILFPDFDIEEVA